MRIQVVATSISLHDSTLLLEHLSPVLLWLKDLMLHEALLFSLALQSSP